MNTDDDINRAELHLRQLATVASEYTTGFGLSQQTYEKVKPALDERSQWVSPAGKTYVFWSRMALNIGE